MPQAIVLDHDRLNRREFHRQLRAATRAGTPFRVETGRLDASDLPVDLKLLLAVASRGGKLAVTGVAGVSAAVASVSAIIGVLGFGAAATGPPGWVIVTFALGPLALIVPLCMLMVHKGYRFRVERDAGGRVTICGDPPA